jgi:hypothetical protein
MPFARPHAPAQMEIDTAAATKRRTDDAAATPMGKKTSSARFPAPPELPPWSPEFERTSEQQGANRLDN